MDSSVKKKKSLHYTIIYHYTFLYVKCRYREILYCQSTKLSDKSCEIGGGLGYLLGVDRSVGVIESPDDIVSKPGARYDGTKPWEEKKVIHQPVCHQNLREQIRFYPFCSHYVDSSTFTVAFSASDPFRGSLTPLESVPGELASFSLVTSEGPEQKSGLFGLGIKLPHTTCCWMHMRSKQLCEVSLGESGMKVFFRSCL